MPVARALSDTFLPNYWKEAERNELAAHHLNHIRWDNNWRNLILVPGDLHHWLNRIFKTWFYLDGSFQESTPYFIQRKTDMSLEDIILPVRREPDMVGWLEGRKTYVYDLDGIFIGYQLTEAELARREQQI